MFPFDDRNTDLWQIAHRHRKEQFEAEADHQWLAVIVKDSTLSQAAALRLCREIRGANRWYHRATWRCRACMLRARQGVPRRMLSPTGPGGCCQVNQRYELSTG